MELADDPVKDPPFWSKTSWIQLGYSLWVNQVVVLIGFSFGFTAVSLPQLSKAPFSISSDEMSWIVSVLVLSAPVGCVISGFAMDRLGRRPTLVFSLVPMTLGWLHTGVSTSATHMIIGRVVTGIGVGMCAGIPRTFCTEITLPNIRGVAGVIPALSIGIGITVEGILGSWLSWPTLCYISVVYSATLLVTNYFILPETPYFVLMSGDMKKTLEALKMIRAKDYDVERELDELQYFQLYNNIRQLPWKKAIHKMFKPYAIKPFSIIMIYNLIGQMTGISIVMFWTVDILKASRSSLDPYAGNVMLGLTRLFASLVMSFLIFWIKRRPLALGSALAIGVLFVGFGVFLQVKAPPSIVPQIVYIVYISLASFGYYSLPLLMLYELIPLQIRGFLGGISMSLIFIMMFLSNKAFPAIRRALGLPGTILLFGVSSLIGFGFLYFFLPETKGLTLHDIEEFYRGRRPTLKRASMVLRRAPSILKQQDSTTSNIKEDRRDSKRKWQETATERKEDSEKSAFSLSNRSPSVVKFKVKEDENKTNNEKINTNVKDDSEKS